VTTGAARPASAPRTPAPASAPAPPARKARRESAVSLLWLDAWQASRRRPALMAEVGRQMNADLDRLSAVIADGIAVGDFPVEQPGEPALQILSLIDGLSVQAATRQTLDYAPVRSMVIATAERLLALPPGTLAAVMEG
jgi:hypothetical protein